jgi:hypothetical protein
MDNQAKTEFVRFVNQMAAGLERFPEISRISLARKGAGAAARTSAAKPPAAQPRAKGDLTTRQAAALLYDSAAMRRARAMGK